jgi:hypothetical protein
VNKRPLILPRKYGQTFFLRSHITYLCRR